MPEHTSLYDQFLAERNRQENPPSLYERFLAEQSAPGPTRVAASRLPIDTSPFGVDLLGQEREDAPPSLRIAGLPLPTPPARDTDPSPMAPPVRTVGLPSSPRRDLPLSALNQLLQPEPSIQSASVPDAPPVEPLVGVEGTWEVDKPSQFMQGLRTGFESGRSGVGETLETVGGLTGLEGIEARGEAMSEASRGRQEGYTGRITDVRQIRNPLESPAGFAEDFKDWAAFALGQGLGSTAAPIVGGAVGAAAGGPVGATVGALGPSYALILGEIRGEMERAGVDPAMVDKVAPLAAVPASALEALLPAALGRKAISGTAAKFGKELAGKLLRRGAQGMVVEGATEAGQDAIAKGATAATSEQEFLTPETAWSLVNSALAGALPGAAFGAGGAVTEGRFGPGQTPEGDGAPAPLPRSPDPLAEPTFMRRGGRTEIETVGPDRTRVTLAPPTPQEVAEARERRVDATDTGTQAVDVMPTEQERATADDLTVPASDETSALVQRFAADPEGTTTELMSNPDAVSEEAWNQIESAIQFLKSPEVAAANPTLAENLDALTELRGVVRAAKELSAPAEEIPIERMGPDRQVRELLRESIDKGGDIVTINPRMAESLRDRLPKGTAVRLMLEDRMGEATEGNATHVSLRPEHARRILEKLSEATAPAPAPTETVTPEAGGVSLKEQARSTKRLDDGAYTMLGYDIVDESGRMIGDVSLTIGPNGAARIGDIKVSGGAGSLGARQVARIRRMLTESNPEITSFEGGRVSGTRGAVSPETAGAETSVPVQATEAAPEAEPVLRSTTAETGEGTVEVDEANRTYKVSAPGGEVIGNFRDVDQPGVDGPRPDRAELFFAEVEKSQRRQGLGKRLATQALDFVRSRGATRVILHPTTPEGGALIASLKRDGLLGEELSRSPGGRIEFSLPAVESTTEAMTEPEALSQEGGGPEVAGPEGTVPPVGEARQMPVSEIRVAPERFQFKDNTDEQGVTRTLKGVKKWDPNSAGVILVWRDPADGETYVVNGHHRLELANRLGVPNVLVRHIEAADAGEARVQGALANIREGRGTSVDAAKLFREEGITPADLEEYGVSLTEAVARDGLALANLHPTIFRDVSTGRLKEQRAAVIGSSGLSQEEQLGVYQALQKREKRGRRPTNDEIAEIIRKARQAGTTEVTQNDLFGEQTVEKSNLFEWGEVSSYIKGKLARTQRRFNPLSKDDVAEDVQEQGVGRIDPARAEAIAAQAGRLEELYDRLSTKSGPVAKALNNAAARIARGEDRNEVKQEAYREVQRALEREVAGAQGADPTGTEAPAGRRGAAQEAATEAEAVAGEREAELERIRAGTKRVGDTRGKVEEVAESAVEPDAALDRFTAEMTPAAAANARKALGVQMQRAGRVQTRREIVEEMVGEGATVVSHPTDGRRLQTPDGRFIEERRLGKTAMSFAESLTQAPQEAPSVRVKLTPSQLSVIETRMHGDEQVDGLVVEDGHLVVTPGTAETINEISNILDEDARSTDDAAMARLNRGGATSFANLYGKVLDAEESLPKPQEPAPQAGDALEIQGNLLGEDEAVGGSEQRSLIGEDPETLDRQERVARQTVDRLRPIMEGGTPTEEQRAQYRDALALIRRNEGQSAEETALRAEGEPVTEEEQGGDLFGGPMGDMPQGATIPQADREAPGPQTEEAIAPPKRPKRTVTVGSRTLHPIAPVELARIAEQLLGGEGTSRIFTKKYPSARGMFYPDPTLPRIGLNPSLGQDYEQFARTLAHEVGHLIDFLPDMDMNRGNILGRLATLKSHLSTTIDATPSDPSQALTPDDRKAVRKRAMRKVGPRPAKDNEADLAAWREEVSRLYAEMIQEEIADRGLLTREAVHEELIALSEHWRPYDRASASESFIKYRESSPELYADAMSVLLNDPATLQEMAPTFFDAWMAYSSRKPDVKRAYEAVQSLIGEPGAVMAARKEEIERDFERGEEQARAAEEQGPKQPVINYLRQAFLERGAPVTDAEKKRVGSVPAHSEERAVRMALQEHQHADNVNRVMLTDIRDEVHEPMIEAGITPEQAGRFLMLQRIADGDRGGMAEQAKEAIQELTGYDTWERAKEAYIARQGTEEEFDPDLLELAESGVLNPHGYTPDEAARTLDALRDELGAEKFARLGELMQRFRDILFNPVETAVALGTYNKETFEKRILPNRDTYAPFAVLDYFNGRMPAGVRKQTGTVRGIANPYATAMLKAMSLNRLNEYQRVKLQILKVLDTDFPGMAGEEQTIDKYHRESTPSQGRANFMYMRDGKLYYREVDEYIAKVLEQADLGFVGRMSKGLSNKAYGLFHPLYVTWSLGWQVRNVQRDFKRTYKNLASARSGQPTYRQVLGAVYDIFKLNKAYAKTAGAAWRHAKGRSDPLIREMLTSRALGRAFHSFEPNIEDAKYERLLQQYGLQEPRSKGWKQIARSIGHVIEEIGVFQETWSKAATYDLLEKVEGLSPRERSYIVRNYAGTPDSTQRGLVSEGVNGVVLYANVIMAGWRADAEVATQPQTASGYWFRAFMIDFLPKAAMAAAVFGFFGDDMEEWMDRVPSYDKEKYLVVPIPPFWSENEAGERKAVYLRVPHDDVNRVFSGAIWAAFMTNAGHNVSRTLGLISGEFGGLNPALALPYAWYQVARGKNPEDTFRGRKIVPQTEWEAGGWHRWKELIRYTAGQFGIASDLAGYFTNEYPDDSKSTTAEKIVRSIPGVSSLIKVSNRGLTEERWWEIDRERRQRAKLRADLPTSVRRATSERARLNRFGEERLTDIEKERREQLNAWYRNVYMPSMDALEQARDTDDQGGFDRAMAELERLMEAFNEDPTQVPRRSRPSRPERPSRPSR